MARPLRIEYPGAFYHVINRGQSRRDIFLEDKGRQTFLDLLAEIARLWKIEIHAYCLMSNHYHLLESTPAAGLSRAMRHLGGIYTQNSTGCITAMGRCFGAATSDPDGGALHPSQSIGRRHGNRPGPLPLEQPLGVSQQETVPDLASKQGRAVAL